jgi:hypothetical protein
MGTESPFQSRTQFEKAVTRLIADAKAQNRADDLDRLVAHLERTPADVSKLASLLLLVDDDVRPELKQSIDAYRRFVHQKGRPIDDDAILAVLREVYERER